MTKEQSLRESLARTLGPSDGAQLLEFGLVLPILLLLVLGVWDFGASFALKQKLTNAAREGARIVVSTPLTNFNCGNSTPCPIEAAAQSVVDYLTKANVEVSCIDPSSPTTVATVGEKWTWSCSNGTTLDINRSSAILQGAVYIPATVVTLTYPLKWRLATLLPRTTFSKTVTTAFTMENMTGSAFDRPSSNAGPATLVASSRGLRDRIRLIHR
ncbi:MAG TPA: TadE/TadG family type IV pilus assembly protein [Candidatus Acidoferrales bacterium]|nr:TadE/TadG family type IV pilus assembly protein [Candidatus Acidoferrales bacterium]